MKIVQLTAENIKRLHAIQITPDGSMVTICGRNAQGKTSVLDAITYALGGKDAVCDQPVRKGEARAKVVCDLDELVVTRTFTAAGGGNLTVTAKNGEKLAGPQGVLDRLVGKLTFDPLGFSRMDPKQQAATLRALAGLDFSQIDAARQASYDGRTVVNRTITQLEAQIGGMPRHDQVPASEVTMAELLQEMQEATDREAAHRVEASEITEIGRVSERIKTRLTEVARAIAALCEEQGKLEDELEAQNAKLRVAHERHARYVAPDMPRIRQKMSAVEDINRKVRENKRRAEVEEQLAKAKAEAADITARIDELDAKKRGMLESASFPVPGLGFDEGGITLDGIPFSQSSAAEQLRTSVAIGLAMNPTLRVLLIRDGSLLDSESLAMIAQMAEERDAQVWIERVSDGAGSGVVIEDGCVATVTT